MIRRLMEQRRGTLVAALAATAISLAACGGSVASPGAGGTAPGGGGGAPGASTPAPAATAGKSLADFDPCAVMSDQDLIGYINASAGDPSAVGTLSVTDTPENGPDNAGLAGSKACQQSWTTTSSDRTVSEGGEPPMVLFEQYSNLKEFSNNGTEPKIHDYDASGASAFSDGAGGAYITKNGYLFHMQGNSDTKMLEALALGIASRL
jgi:hypothetical protein